jgi:hypothetical protein
VAIDDLPLPVVNLLNIIGVEWPYINEDDLMRFAQMVREFGTAVKTTHQDATDAIDGIAQAHQGASTAVLRSGWAKLSSAHVTEIVEGCEVLAVALEAWAAYVVVQKGEAIAELVSMAAAFFADQAAAVATAGIAEAAVPLIIAGAKKLAESLIEDLNMYVQGEIIQAAAKPLFAKVESALSGLDWSQAGVGGGSAEGFTLDLEELERQTTMLHTHAATMRSHVGTLKAGIAGLSF